VRSRERGAIDVHVDNATYQHNVEPIDALSDEQWDRTFRMNIHTRFYLASAAIPRTRRGSNDHQYGLDYGA
jgi:NAD(P)-dependent dehydrogenase (short-subunit alcohol dehydrogenase family)